MGLFVWFFPLKGQFSCLKDVLCVKGWVGERQKLRPVNRASYNCYVQVRIASDTEVFGVGISFPKSGFSGFTGSLEINLLGIWVTSAHYGLLFFLHLWQFGVFPAILCRRLLRSLGGFLKCLWKNHEILKSVWGKSFILLDQSFPNDHGGPVWGAVASARVLGAGCGGAEV